MTTKPANNLLLDGLGERDRKSITSAGEMVALRGGELLADVGRAMAYAFFPLDCAIAIVVSQTDQTRLGVGLVGREGMVGVPLILGAAAAPLRAVVQSAGSAWRVDAIALAGRLRASERLRSTLLKYVHVRYEQMAQVAVCKSAHGVEARLARWLLMSGDRLRRADLLLTHELLAKTLGVRRAGVTLAASALQERRLIRYARGRIELLDPQGLAVAACPCYVADKRIYARLLG